MNTIISREVHLASRPVGVPTRDNFEIVENTINEPRDNELLVKNLWMSVDPAMRPRMVDRKSYVAPYEIGKVLEGRAIGVVLKTKHSDFQQGDYVFGTEACASFS